MIKGSIQEEDIVLVDVHAPSIQFSRSVMSDSLQPHE